MIAYNEHFDSLEGYHRKHEVFYEVQPFVML